MGRTLRYGFTMLWGALPALALFFLLSGWRQNRLDEKRLHSSLAREITMAFLWMYSGGIAIIGITPRWIIYAFEDLLLGLPWNQAGLPFWAPGEISLIPFRTFAYSSYVLVGNILLFVPFGLFAALLWRRFRWWKAFLTGIGISLFLECCQLFVGRTFDIDDLMLNTFGVLCGFWVSPVAQRLFPRLTAKLQVAGIL